MFSIYMLLQELPVSRDYIFILYSPPFTSLEMLSVSGARTSLLTSLKQPKSNILGHVSTSR